MARVTRSAALLPAVSGAALLAATLALQAWSTRWGSFPGDSLQLKRINDGHLSTWESDVGRAFDLPGEPPFAAALVIAVAVALNHGISRRAAALAALAACSPAASTALKVAYTPFDLNTEIYPDVVDGGEEEGGVPSRLTKTDAGTSRQEGTPWEMFAASTEIAPSRLRSRWTSWPVRGLAG